MPASDSISKYKTFSILLIITLLAFTFRYGLNVFLAKHLGAGLYGDFSIGLVILEFVSSAIVFGLDLSAQKYLKSYLNAKNKNKLLLYLNWNYGFLKKSILISLCLISCFTATIFALHFFYIKSVFEHHYAVYFLWVAPLGAIAALFCGLYSGNQNYYLSLFFSKAFGYLLMLLLFLALIFFLDEKITSAHTIVVIFTSYALLILIQLVTMSRTEPILFHFLKWSLNLKSQYSLLSAEWQRTSLMLFLNNAIYRGASFLGLLVVETIDPVENDVGRLAAITTIVTLIWLVGSSVNRFLSPEIARLLYEGQHQELQKTLTACIRFKLVILTPLCIFLLVYARSILLYFGPEFEAAYLPLIISIVVAFVGSAVGSSALLLAFGNQEALVFKLTTTELGVILALGVVGTHYFGLIGMASAEAVGILYKAVLSVWFAKKRLGINSVKL